MYMLGVNLPQGDICVLRTTYRENIAYYTRRSYKTRESKFGSKRDIREFCI